MDVKDRSICHHLHTILSWILGLRSFNRMGLLALYSSPSEIQGLEQYHTPEHIISNDVFELHRSTGSGLFAILGCDFEQIFEQIVSIRVNTLSSTEW